jgi:hypothetical protein
MPDVPRFPHPAPGDETLRHIIDDHDLPPPRRPWPGEVDGQHDLAHGGGIFAPGREHHHDEEA